MFYKDKLIKQPYKLFVKPCKVFKDVVYLTLT